MSKVRVYDLARELGLTNKELIDLLEAEGEQVKSHSSSLECDFADLIRDKVISQRRAKTGAGGTPAAESEAGRKTVTPSPAAVESTVVPPPVKAKPPENRPTPGSEIHLKPPIIVRDLAEAIGRKPNELIGELMTMNVFATINQVIDVDVVEKICLRHGLVFVRERRSNPARAKVVTSALAPTAEAASERTTPRPPVVAFLGHVDHGKTSLQDAIRKTNVAKGELGGITQRIGASVVEWKGNMITMLDTPGHEAFTAMRARGANATDIVILVVAGDDGVMPQTIEAINHAQAAKVPLVVAINKMDLPGVNPDRVLIELQKQGLNPEEWGGDVGVVKVSAITGMGIDDLLERILLEAEVMELKGNPLLPAKGVVIEAQMESGMGPTAHILVRNGTLHLGDYIVCGRCCGKVKALADYFGKRISSAGPSTPVKLLGLSGVPEPGDLLEYYETEQEAKRVVEERTVSIRQNLNIARQTTFEDMFKKLAEDTKAELKLIVKADVRGSVEAIVESLNKVLSEKIKINILHTGVGEITENDVSLAGTSNALIIGFHVRAMPGVNSAARNQGVEIRLYGIIYELLDDIERILLGKLEPDLHESRVGLAEIIQVFNLSRSGKICGCRINEGTVRVGANARVKRGADIIYKGRIQSLRRFQDDVREVKNGFECGIRLDNFEDFEVGDVIEVMVVEKVAATL